MNHSNRILSLDVFRGIIIMLMILVNSPGTEFPYPILDHAVWNGCTFADLVFPSFLFIVGLTTVISLNKPQARSYARIIKRSLILFALGLLLNMFPHHFDLAGLRFYGVLQRIAVCYCVCALLYLHTSFRVQLSVFVGILLGYWVMMTLVPVPGFGANQLTPEGTWVAYIDQMLFSSQHLYRKVYDPEGLFSTLPAIASTLIGVLTGSLLLSSRSKYEKFSMMICYAWLMLLIGWLWSFNFPINKNLWTSSYVLWCGAFALLTFALCYWLVDIQGYVRWSLPFKIFGMNALFVFVVHVVLLKLQGGMRYQITNHLFAGFNPQDAAVLYAIGFILVNFLVAWVLYWRKIFIKI